MSLSNYVGASVIVFAVTRFVDFATMTSVIPALSLAVSILIVQNIVSRLWLRSFRYGPAEWIWRMVTWRELVPLRRSVGLPDRDAAPATS